MTLFNLNHKNRIRVILRLGCGRPELDQLQVASTPDASPNRYVRMGVTIWQYLGVISYSHILDGICQFGPLRADQTCSDKILYGCHERIISDVTGAPPAGQDTYP